MEDDSRSVTINIPKPRVCANSAEGLLKTIRTKKILKRTMEKDSKKPSDSSLKKHLLLAEKPLPALHFKREELLIPYKTYTKTQQKDKHKQKLSVNLREKYKIISTDIQRRLYIENPPDDVFALTCIDKGFFNYPNGRPVSDRVPVFKSLKAALADLMRIKYEIGIRNESILNITINIENELETYDLSLKRCKEQVKSFDEFISEDYLKSMSFLERWDGLKLKLNLKVLELQNLAAEQFTIISRLMGLDYMYGLQQKYGRFLYYLSPPSWRSRNREFAKSVEIEAKGFDLGNSSEEDTFNVVFDKMQRECFAKFVKPVLYFTHPRDLLDIFDAIEKQQLNHFAYVTHLAPHKKLLKEGAKCLKDMISHDSASVGSIIKGFEKLLVFSNERCVELETTFFRILNGLFYESVGAPEVLKLFVHLEFCYERVNAEKALNMDIYALAKSLEGSYMDYSKHLDAVHSDTVKRAMNQSLESERWKMRRARHAARELRQFQRLERDMLGAFKPIRSRSQPFVKPVNINKLRNTIKKASSKPNVKTTEKKPISIDESEMEYLRLFTDWNEGDDPARYLHRLEEQE